MMALASPPMIAPFGLAWSPPMMALRLRGFATDDRVGVTTDDGIGVAANDGVGVNRLRRRPATREGEGTATAIAWIRRWHHSLLFPLDSRQTDNNDQVVVADGSTTIESCRHRRLATSQ